MNKFDNLILIVTFLLIPLVSAQSSYFDIDLNCYQGCKDGTANIEKDIMLKLTIKNNFDFWIYMGDKEKWDKSSSVWITSENSNLKDGQSKELYQFVIGNPIYIPPKSEINFYIPLDTYNSLENEKRIGDWSVKADMRTDYTPKYYENPFNGKTVSILSEYQIPSQLTTNLLKFEAKKEEVKVDIRTIPKIIEWIKKFLKEWMGYIFAGIIIAVVGGLILFLIKKK